MATQHVTNPSNSKKETAVVMNGVPNYIKVTIRYAIIPLTAPLPGHFKVSGLILSTVYQTTHRKK